MLKVVKKIESKHADYQLSLPLETRVKSRFKSRLEDGQEVCVFLNRGSVLRDGQRLQTECGVIIEIVAADEVVSVVKTSDAHLFSRACYHLGNRHVPLQILPNELRYQHDHVLDQMLEGFNLVVTVEEKPFEPEPGAYGSHHHTHEH